MTVREPAVAPLRAEDWEAVRSIYGEGMATGQATFETTVPSWDEWNATHLPYGRLMAHESGVVLGWAALTAVSNRCVYEGVAEVSVYVAGTERGKGIGSLLLERLIRESEANGVWTLQAGIFPENVASLRMHEKLGFRIVGRRTRIGRLAGRWRDVLLLERRSEVVGVDLPDERPPVG